MERILGLFSCDCDQSCRILHGAVHGSHFVYNDVFLRLCLECVFFLLVGGSLTFAGQKNLCWPDCHRSRFDASFMSSPSVDIFMAGFPCQPFSRAGLGHGTLDPRGTVVFRLISWIEVHLPVIFVLEKCDRTIGAARRPLLLRSWNSWSKLVSMKSHGLCLGLTHMGMFHSTGSEFSFVEFFENINQRSLHGQTQFL